MLSGGGCENLDEFSVGDPVRVEFSLRGREWKSPQGELKYFNSLGVWTVERGGAAGFPEEPPLPDVPPPSADDEIPF